MSRCMEAPNDCGGFVGVSGKVPAKRGARPGRWAAPVPHLSLSPPPAWAPHQEGPAASSAANHMGPCAFVLLLRVSSPARSARGGPDGRAERGEGRAGSATAFSLIMDRAVIF